ncbi:lipid II:glycine glycyltransferase FemX [Devosia sp.]|uniref:lipid II:glycine glycyltransferase FemX n=1 Tax=Devosia sp. TaxID=1871048 RepID=UPI003A957FCD
MTLELKATTDHHADVGATVRPATIEIAEVSDRETWDGLMAAAPAPHLPQSLAYGEGKRAKGWTVRRVTFSQNSKILAFATVLELRRFGIRLLSRVNRGPVFMSTAPDAATITAVHGALRRRWGRLPFGVLLIAPAIIAAPEHDTALRAAGYRLRQRQSWMSGRIALDTDEEALWKGFSSTFRNRVRNSEKSGATLAVRQDDEAFEWMLERHAENMQDKGFHAVDATFLTAMRAAAPDAVRIFQMLDDGKPVAGMSVVRFGTYCEYHIGWFGPEGRKLNAGNFLMWQIVREMSRLGCTHFDVGGLKPGDGYTRFKRTMKPQEYALDGEWLSI